LRAMRAQPADRIMVAAAHDDNLDLEPNVDGWVLPQQPAAVFAQGRQIRVPVLEGSNADEITIFASPIVVGHSYRPKTVQEYRQWLQGRTGSFSDAVFAAYPAKRDEDVPQTFVRMGTDLDFTFGAWLLAKQMEQSGQKAFLYRFTYVGAGKFASLGAFHSEELMFLSGHYWTSWVAQLDDAALAHAVVGYWVQFVKNGNPNGGGLPYWPDLANGGKLQELGQHVGSESIPDTQRMSVFQDRLTSRLRATENQSH
jgi:para-nitrobenzyl esterase